MTNLYEKILQQAQDERHRRARQFQVSDALLAKAAIYRAQKGILLPQNVSHETRGCAE